MNKYKVLLVDDEAEVRRNIAQKIPWENLGFTLVSEAENGEDALEKFLIYEPDLVITDIKMPYMDGLTLAKEVKKHRNSTEVVLFSGFNEFEYAQKAIKLNVLEYILKPVNLEELIAILERIKTKIDNRLTEKRDLLKLRNNWQKMLPTLIENFICDVLNNKMDKTEIKEGIERFDLPIKSGSSWIVATTYIKTPMTTGNEHAIPLHRERDLIPISVKEIINEKLESEFKFANFIEKGFPGIICSIEDKKDIETLIGLLNQCCIDCRKILKLDVTIGIGRAYDKQHWISESFKEARDALGYRATLGEGTTIYVADVEGNPSSETLLFTPEDETELTNIINFGSKDEIHDFVSHLVERMEKTKAHTSQHQIYLLSIINSIMQIVQKHNLDIYMIWGKEIDYFEIISLLLNTEHVHSFLLNTCYLVNEQLNKERDTTAKNLVRKAQLFISENYIDPELSVDMICEHLHISQAYFSTLFKNEVGDSYISYLTNLRLKKAKEFLEYTDNKTYLIAINVGYSSANYFSYAFKKAFGVAPSKYREQLKQ